MTIRAHSRIKRRTHNRRSRGIESRFCVARGAIIFEDRLPIRQGRLHIPHPIHIQPVGNRLLPRLRRNIYLHQKRFYSGRRINRHRLHNRP